MTAGSSTATRRPRSDPRPARRRSPEVYSFVNDPRYGGGWTRCCYGRLRHIQDCCSRSSIRINGDYARARLLSLRAQGLLHHVPRAHASRVDRRRGREPWRSPPRSPAGPRSGAPEDCRWWRPSAPSCTGRGRGGWALWRSTPRGRRRPRPPSGPRSPPPAALLGAPWGRAGALIVAAVAVLYLVRELTGIRVPVPQLRRQVPDWWRTYFGRPARRVPLRRRARGRLLHVPRPRHARRGHGRRGVHRQAAPGGARDDAVRARERAGAARRRTLEGARGRRASRRPPELDVGTRPRRAVNAVALAGVAVAAAASVSRAQGGWGEAAAATLAVSFAWASASKLTGWGRWRRTLSAHALPQRAERLAAWVVPAAESLVPVLTLLGRPRAAAPSRSPRSSSSRSRS